MSIEDLLIECRIQWFRHLGENTFDSSKKKKRPCRSDGASALYPNNSISSLSTSTSNSHTSGKRSSHKGVCIFRELFPNLFLRIPFSVYKVLHMFTLLARQHGRNLLAPAILPLTFGPLVIISRNRLIVLLQLLFLILILIFMKYSFKRKTRL